MSKILLPIAICLTAAVSSAPAQAQTPQTTDRPGQSRMNLRLPAVSTDGRTVVFPSHYRPDARYDTATNLFRWRVQPTGNVVDRLTNYDQAGAFAGVTSVDYPGTGDVMAFTAILDGAESVHAYSLSSRSDRSIPVDTTDCVLVQCVDCLRSCLRSVHLTETGSHAVYEVGKNNPFHTVTTDGTNVKAELPVYQGSLAPSPMRVISSGGILVFTSAAPDGPTFAPAATDVYALNLNGNEKRRVTDFGDPRFVAFHAVISRDGSKVAFETNYSAGGPTTQQIWVANTDGSQLHPVSFGAHAAYGPSLTADGTQVTYVQNGQVIRIPASVDPLGLIAPQSLTNLRTSEAMRAVSSEDGQFVVLTVGPIGGPSYAIYRIPTTGTTRFEDFTEVFAPSFLFTDGIVDATGTGQASPGSLITAYGANLSPEEFNVATAFPLPNLMGRMSLFVNSSRVPLQATTPWQINAQLPMAAVPPNGLGAFQVRYDDGLGLELVNSPIVDYSPAVFVMGPGAGAGTLQGAVVRTGTTFLADAANPVSPGDPIEIYGLGLGLTTPRVAPGGPSPGASGLAKADRIPIVKIGGINATVQFAGLTPGLAGVYQINVTVPQGLRSGTHRITFQLSDGREVGETSIVVR